MLLTAFGAVTPRLTGVIRRRTTYLEARARALRSRDSRRETDVWKTKMLCASLWLEASESAACIGLWHRAAKDLMQGALILLELQVPAGAAIAGFFLDPPGKLREHAFGALREMQRRRQAPRGEQQEPHSRQDFATAAIQQPQQLAYAYLATRGLGLDADLVGVLEHDLRSLAAVPFGRQRIPVRDLELLLHPTEMREGSARDGTQVLIDALTGLFRSIELARTNSYLWDRMLSMPPLFDVDLGLMVAAYISRDKGNQALSTLQERLAQPMDPRERLFAKEFLLSVMRIRNISGITPTPQAV